MKFLPFLTLLLAPIISFANIPDFPMAFWGSVSIDGAAAPAGSIVRVYDGATKVGEITVEETGVYGYTEPTKQKLLVTNAQGALQFTIQAVSLNGGVEIIGLSPVTHPSFVSGETIEKNIQFTLATSPVVNSGGGSSGGGGGGGGSSKRVESPQAQVLGVASTTFTESEQKIALQKQLIELLTLLIALLKQKMLTM